MKLHALSLRLAAVLENILRALDPDSRRRIIYLSLKEGHGKGADASGRMFFFWQDDALRTLFSTGQMHILDFQRRISADGRGNVWLGYVLHHRPSHKAKGRRNLSDTFSRTDDKGHDSLLKNQPPILPVADNPLEDRRNARGDRR